MFSKSAVSMYNFPYGLWDQGSSKESVFLCIHFWPQAVTPELEPEGHSICIACSNILSCGFSFHLLSVQVK